MGRTPPAATTQEVSTAMHPAVHVTRTRRAPSLILALMLVTPPLLLAAGTTSGAPPATVRFATFNASLNRAVHYGSLAAPTPGSALADFLAPFNPAEPDLALRQRRNQAANVAEVIQRVRPEILLINELDYVEGPIDGNAATDAFQANYLAVSQNGAVPIDYPHVFVAPSNTGISSGKDLDNNGQVVTTPGSGLYGNDSFGFGEYPGRFGMGVLSRRPIDRKGVRTFQLFRWNDMPGNLIPTPFYSPDEVAVLRLSSKSHWDLPIRVPGGGRVHFLVSHPTPPVFDGPEDRNGRRNHDEIRFWADYISPARSSYI